MNPGLASNIHARSSALADRAPAGDPGSGFGEFFRYHGYLSPGVRLFRSMGFPAKSVCVAVAFMVPLLMLLAFVAAGVREQIDFANAERRGLHYLQPVDDLLQAARARRRIASGQGEGQLAQTQEPVRQAFERVRQREAELGTEFGTADAFARLAEAHEALLRAPQAGDADATFHAHSAFIQTVLALVGKVADGSQLSLDPELETYHLMSLGVLRLPQQAENTARLRGIGLMTLRSQQLTPARRDALQRGVGVAEFLDAEVANSYQTLAANAAQTAKLLDTKAPETAVAALKAAVGQQLLGAELARDTAAFQAVADAAVDAVHTLQAAAVSRLDMLLQERAARLQRTLAWQVGTTLLFVALAAYLMLAFYKVMLGGLTEVAGHLRAIAKGDLGTAPRPWGTDEAAPLMLTLSEMQGSLRRIIGSVLAGAQQVQTASEEIAAASQDLSGRTEKTAASLQQTASSMEEIASTVKQTAETVVGATAIVQANAGAATRGGEVIAQVVRTMQGIQTSSNKIGEIIGVIDSIAFQTNILALNAAVEAARAGEQGRGFAVVATEVRALAGRSAAAAREIKSLISASIEQVEAGSRVAAEAGTTIGEVVGNAGRMAALMGEIATATREQSSSVGLVGGAVMALDRSTQQNAALVEQTSAAASALSTQAQQLANEAGFFRIQ